MIHDMTNYLLCHSLNQKCGVPIGAVLSMLTVVFMSTWMPTQIPKDAYDRGVDRGVDPLCLLRCSSCLSLYAGLWPHFGLSKLDCLQRKENEVRCVRWVWVEDLKFDFDLVLMFFMVHWGLESWSLVSNARRFSRFNNLPRAPRKPQLFKLRPKEDVALLCPQYSCLPLDSISADFDFDSVTAYQICEATLCGKVLDSGASSLLGMNWQR